MSANTVNTFSLNGSQYDITQLTPQGRQLLNLLTEAQNELVRLDSRKELVKAAQQHLISQLKPLLPQPIKKNPTEASAVLGQASKEIPITPIEELNDKPASMPDNIPEAFKLQHH